MILAKNRFRSNHATIHSESKWGVVLLLMVPPLCWAGNAVLARGVIHTIPPISFAFWRWTLAFSLLAPFAWPHVKTDWSVILQHWKMMLGLSGFGIAAFNTLLYLAVHTTTAINSALIQTTMPVFILVMTMIGFRESVNFRHVSGIMLCILGAAVVVLRGDLHVLLRLSFVQGDLLMLIAVMCYGVYTVLLKKRPPIHPMTFLSMTFGLGAMMLAPLYWWEHRSMQTMAWSSHVVLAIGYVAVFPSIVAYFCWNRGTEMIGPNRAGLFINLVPVFAAVMSLLWLNEPPKFFHLVGLVLIVGGMVLFNFRYTDPSMQTSISAADG